jgi:acetyl-CoA C-acetyltransferase
VPVHLPQKKGDPIVFAKDEYPRETSLETLAKLKGVVKPDGTVTAGNASGVNDGSCALLLASEQGLKDHGLTPKRVWSVWQQPGCRQESWALARAPATLKVLELTGMSLSQIDLIEFE